MNRVYLCQWSNCPTSVAAKDSVTIHEPTEEFARHFCSPLHAAAHLLRPPFGSLQPAYDALEAQLATVRTK